MTQPAVLIVEDDANLREALFDTLCSDSQPVLTADSGPAALEIIAELTAQGAVVKAFDPKAAPEEVRQYTEFRFCENAYEVVEGADALVIVTDWPEFKDLNFKLIKTAMRNPVIIDTKNMLDDRQLVASGMTYFGVGRGK